MSDNPLSIILKSLFVSKENLLETMGNEYILKNYNIYIINRILAKHKDILPFIVELNKFNTIKPDEHYEYLLYSIPKGRRFAKMKKPKEYKDIEYIKQHYNISEQKAIEVMKILSSEDVKKLKELYT